MLHALCVLFLTIIVPPLPDLLAVFAFDVFFNHTRTGQIAGITGFPEGFHTHRIGQIDTGEIHQAEGAHRMAGSVNLGFVDIFHTGSE